MGHFAQPPFQSDAFEAKWGVHAKGEAKSQAAANKTAETVSVLIRGKFSISLPETDQTLILENEGDYVYWDSGIAHSWEALEDCVVLTLRWPSLAGDQA